MKLYWGPHTCAIGIHALLEEIGAPYTLEKVDTLAGAHRTETFKALNPKEKVPVLVCGDGTVMTEYGTIARWLADTYPEKHLQPADNGARAHASEMMDYAIGTLHGQAFRRIFFPTEFTKDEAHKDAVKQDGKTMVRRGFDILSEDLGPHPFAAGDAFSIADTALFYTARWARMIKIDLPANVTAHLGRIGARPAFLAASAQEKA